MKGTNLIDDKGQAHQTDNIRQKGRTLLLILFIATYSNMPQTLFAKRLHKNKKKNNFFIL